MLFLQCRTEFNSKEKGMCNCAWPVAYFVMWCTTSRKFSNGKTQLHWVNIIWVRVMGTVEINLTNVRLNNSQGKLQLIICVLRRSSSCATTNHSVMLCKTNRIRHTTPPAILYPTTTAETNFDFYQAPPIPFSRKKTKFHFIRRITVEWHRFSFLLPKTVLYMQLSTNSA